ncbi:MAG: homocysteine S-methyltransferase family protein [Atribacterota bacterium]
MLSEILYQRVFVFDGAMGTRLQAAGLPAGFPPDEWNLSHPNIVAGIHQSYVRAGSDIIQTNTFGANRLRLQRNDLEGKITDINRQAVHLARSIIEENTILCASIGPLGDFIEPLGNLTREKARDAFREQVDILQGEGITLFHLETFHSTVESSIASEVILKSGGEVIASFTFEPRGNGTFTTLMGETPGTIVSVFKDIPITALGANCGTGIREMTQIVKIFRESYSGPISCKPNAGLPRMENDQVVYTESPEDFSSQLPLLLKSRVSIIGGCCGTDERYIRNIADVIHQ